MSLACAGVWVRYEEGGGPGPGAERSDLELRAGGAAGPAGRVGLRQIDAAAAVRGLNDARRGRVVLDGLATGDGGLRRTAAAQTGLVFQMAEMQLFADSAAEDVAFGPAQLGWPAGRGGRRGDGRLERVGLPRRPVRRARIPTRFRAANSAAWRSPGCCHAAAPAAPRRAIREPRSGHATRAAGHPAAAAGLGRGPRAGDPRRRRRVGAL